MLGACRCQTQGLQPSTSAMLIWCPWKAFSRRACSETRLFNGSVDTCATCLGSVTDIVFLSSGHPLSSYYSSGKPRFHFQNGDCPKCGIFNAWSDGKKDVCHVLPRKKTELITLLTGGAVVVILTFLAFEILHAPLMILDAKSDLADPAQAESKRTFTLSVQGPIVDLHKNLSRLGAPAGALSGKGNRVDMARL